MRTFQREVQLRTAGGFTVTDITDEVRDAVRESGIQAGICCLPYLLRLVQPLMPTSA